MKFLFVSPGKIKDKSIRTLADDYLSRINRFIKAQSVETKEIKGVSSKDLNKIILEEGRDLSKFIKKGSFAICLDERGKNFSTKEFASFLSGKLNSSLSEMVFLVGGPFGISEEVKKQSNLLMSLSKMTFPHELSKVILLEQVYRVLTIIRGQRYHY